MAGNHTARELSDHSGHARGDHGRTPGRGYHRSRPVDVRQGMPHLLSHGVVCRSATDRDRTAKTFDRVGESKVHPGKEQAADGGDGFQAGKHQEAVQGQAATPVLDEQTEQDNQRGRSGHRIDRGERARVREPGHTWLLHGAPERQPLRPPRHVSPDR